MTLISIIPSLPSYTTFMMSSTYPSSTVANNGSVSRYAALLFISFEWLLTGFWYSVTSPDVSSPASTPSTNSHESATASSTNEQEDPGFESNLEIPVNIEEPVPHSESLTSYLESSIDARPYCSYTATEESSEGRGQRIQSCITHVDGLFRGFRE